MSTTQQIILAEDNPADVKLAELALKELPGAIDMKHFPNGKDLLEYLQTYSSQNISFILLDLNMPKMNGLDFLKARLDDPQLSEIPVVVFTCSNDPRDIFESYKLKANAFVNKPVDLDEYERTFSAIIQFWSGASLKVTAEDER